MMRGGDGVRKVTSFCHRCLEYIKVDYIQEARESSHPYSSYTFPICINGVTVRDSKEKVIVSFGKTMLIIEVWWWLQKI